MTAVAVIKSEIKVNWNFERGEGGLGGAEEVEESRMALLYEKILLGEQVVEHSIWNRSPTSRQ